MSYDYEMTLIVDVTLSDEKRKKILEEVKKLITSNNGKLASDKLWGKKKLVYPVKGVKEGYYYIFNFVRDGKETAQLSNKLKLNEGILRYLILRK